MGAERPMYYLNTTPFLHRNWGMQYMDTCSEHRGCLMAAPPAQAHSKRDPSHPGALPASKRARNKTHPHQPARAYAMKTSDCARAAEMLPEARATRRWLDALPEGAQPASETEAYAIQDMVARRLGPIVGWKVGSAPLAPEPFRAPIHEATLRIEDPRLPADLFHVIGVEAEIVYRFARDPPPRATPPPSPRASPRFARPLPPRATPPASRATCRRARLPPLRARPAAARDSHRFA